MGVEEQKGNAGVGSERPSGVLHQRRSLPLNPTKMAVGGAVIVATIAYFTLYAKSKPGTTHSDVARTSSGTDDASRRSK